MDLLVDNPFRLLGLAATASSRDIAKRVSDLETFAELGKSKTYPSDMPFVGSLVRSVAAIKAAAQKIEQAEGKLFHSFFWFRVGNARDEQALGALSGNNTREALAIWNAELSEGGQRSYTSRLNRAVLRLLLATRSGFDCKLFGRGLWDLGFVMNESLSESVNDVLGTASAGLNRTSLCKRVVDSIVQTARAAPGAPYGPNAMGILGDFRTFPPALLDYIDATVTNPVIGKIEEAVARSERLREDTSNIAELHKLNWLDECEPLVLELEGVLGDEDARFQAVANKYADELCCCAVAAHNDHEDFTLSATLMERAVRAPSFGRVRARIEENRETVDRSVEQHQRAALYWPIYVELAVELSTLEQAETQLRALKTLLTAVRLKVGAGDEGYLNASSDCVSHVLGFLVRTVNSAVLDSTTSKAAELTRKLLGFDLNGDTRVRVQKNLAIIEKMEATPASDGTAVAVRSLAAAQSRPTSAPPAAARGILEQIPGWLWVVGGVSLLAMCNSK